MTVPIARIPCFTAYTIPRIKELRQGKVIIPGHREKRRRFHFNCDTKRNDTFSRKSLFQKICGLYNGISACVILTNRLYILNDHFLPLRKFQIYRLPFSPHPYKFFKSLPDFMSITSPAKITPSRLLISLSLSHAHGTHRTQAISLYTKLLKHQRGFFPYIFRF